MASRPVILGPNGKPFRKTATEHRASLDGRYEAAETTDHNKRHWRAADGLSARSANTLDVRKALRERARCEIGENNSYGKGIVETLANDLVGTGPRLQLHAPLVSEGMDEDQLEQIERDLNVVELRFAEWMQVVGLADDLRVMAKAKVVDGEAFAVLTTNEALPTAVHVDVEVVECDRITDPWLQPALGADKLQCDGIKYDAAGNPVLYYLRNEHPGDTLGSDFSGKWLPARFVRHWYRRDRAGQLRGVPELTTALPLFAQMRRWTLATLTAAETAADLAGLLKSTIAPEEGTILTAKEWDKIEFARGMLMCLPYGYELQQLDSKHPNQTYKDFKRELLSEIARCLSMPYGIAAGDSSDSSYAGGRLEFQSWQMTLRVLHSHLNAVVLLPIFLAWLDEAIMVPGYIPKWITPANVVAEWFYDVRPHVDPSKEASADETGLRTHSTTYQEIYGKKGQYWKDRLRQRGREVGFLKELGLSVATPAGPTNQAAPADRDEDERPPAPANDRNRNRERDAEDEEAEALAA